MWRSLRALGVPQSRADDAAQHVFLIAAKKLDAIEEGKERAFLFATVRGVAANARRLRAAQREVQDEIAFEHAIDNALDPEQVLARKQAVLRLEGILESMSEDLRTVFVLCELEELTTPTVAEILEIPVGTVASRLRRARADFRARARGESELE